MEKVLDYIDRLGEDLEKDDEWRDLPEEQKKSFTSFVLPQDRFGDDAFKLDNFNTAQLWNDADASTRDKMIRDSTHIPYYLVSAVELLKRACWLIDDKFENHVKNSTNDPRAMDLLRFYGTFYAVEIPRPPRQSQAAVSDCSDSSASAVGKVLNADQIHHKMFTDETELSFQKFNRFDMGGKRDPNPTLENLINSFGLQEHRAALSTFLYEALDNFKHARSFLSRRSSALEPLTQTVFVAFLKDLMAKMNSAFRNSSNASVVVVSGMDSIEVPVEISAEYMRSNWKKRKREYQGGNWGAHLKTKSDVAIIQGRSDQYMGEHVGEQQQKMFLNCSVNVEMKKWQLLSNRMNKSPLTQVAAESMTRLQVLKDKCPDVLFSLLTDCADLYSVRHEVRARKYWISRSVNTAEEILLSICWLYLCSIGLVKTKVSDWQTDEDNDKDEVQPDEGGEEEKPSSRLESVNENDGINSRGNDAHGTGHEAPEASFQDNDMALPVFSFEDDNDEEERVNWQNFFLMENHRKYGTPLPLTEAMLSLHKNQYQKGQEWAG